MMGESFHFVDGFFKAVAQTFCSSDFCFWVSVTLTCFWRLNYECVSCFYILMFIRVFNLYSLSNSVLCGGLCVLYESDSVFGCSFGYHFLKQLPPIVQLCVCVVWILLSITAKYAGQSFCMWELGV